MASDSTDRESAVWRFDEAELVACWIEERREDQDVCGAEVGSDGARHDRRATGSLDSSQRLVDVVDLYEELRAPRDHSGTGPMPAVNDAPPISATA